MVDSGTSSEGLDLNSLLQTAMKGNVMNGLLVPYSSVDEQARALASVKAEFENRLADMLGKAVRLGEKLGKAKADEKDLEMYSG